MDLDRYQELTAATDRRPDVDDPVYPLLGLAGEVGSLVVEYKKRLRSRSYEGLETEAREDLGDLLWYAATLARTLGLTLNDVAEANLAKTAMAWGATLDQPSRYDEEFPNDEQLPRNFEVTFAPDDQNGLKFVQMYLGNRAVGQPLNDNTYIEDHYRYHDVFHLAHAAVLGWSPLFRSLLGRKRKSDPDRDRVEDGARSIFIEEGLTAYVFSVASEQGFFESTDRVDWDLLKTVRKMTADLEVGNQPPAAWQSAIFQGYYAWRMLRANEGGVVRGNLDARTLKYVGPASSGGLNIS